MQRRQLVDTHTHLHIQGMLSTDTSPSPSIGPKDSNNPYLTLLTEFPTLTQVCSPDTPIKHEVSHYNETTGPPISSRSRRLAPDCLRVAKKEFEHMLQLGIIRPSSSAWSSPLHMVPKPAIGDPVAITVPLITQRYLIVTLYLIYMIFPLHCRVPLYFLSWT